MNVYLKERYLQPIWKCPECGYECVWTCKEASEDGTPICGVCDIDMEYIGTALNRDVLEIGYNYTDTYTEEKVKEVLTNNSIIYLKDIIDESR